jgi:hypothetical protein
LIFEDFKDGEKLHADHEGTQEYVGPDKVLFEYIDDCLEEDREKDLMEK